MKTITLQSISFTFERAEKPILDNFTAAFSSGWTALVGANGCGKSTLLSLLADEYQPSSGQIIGRDGIICYCRQETLLPPSELDDFNESYDRQAIMLRSSLGLEELAGKSWQELSHGEQKRFQLAVALQQSPDVLLVDEPTNHLDEQNRRFIMDTLAQYKGIGIIVSHDREVLNALAQHCIFFIAGKYMRFSGNYDSAKAELDHKFAHDLALKDQILEKSEGLKTEVARLDDLSRGSHKRLSKRNISHKDHDAKAKIDRARLTNKDMSVGQKKARIENRIAKMQDEIGQLQIVKDYSGAVNFDVDAGHDKLLLYFPSSQITLPNGCSLHVPELVIRTSQKIGLVGLNGMGKTSLVRHLLASEAIRSERIFYLQQELDHRVRAQIRERLDDLPKDRLGQCLQIIGRLGSDPAAILQSQHWSAGELRKVAIALTIIDQTQLLILDEPTNHLDLPSIQNLENALAKSNLTLLVISHDQSFIKNVCSERWVIERINENESKLTIY